MSERVPDLLVERLRLGELSPEEAARVRARLEAEPGGMARLAALEADDRAVLAAHPRLGRRPERAPRATAAWRFGVPAVVAVIAALLIVARVPSSSRDGEAWLRAKGGELAVAPRLIVYRARADAPTGYEVLADGARAAAGDVLQLAYVAAGREVGAILSIDGRGAVTTHLAASPLTQGGEVRLPAGYRLDDAPGFERFVLMTFAPGGALELTSLSVTKAAP